MCEGVIVLVSSVGEWCPGVASCVHDMFVCLLRPWRTRSSLQLVTFGAMDVSYTRCGALGGVLYQALSWSRSVRYFIVC